jgi:hypothetical protein
MCLLYTFILFRKVFGTRRKQIAGNLFGNTFFKKGFHKKSQKRISRLSSRSSAHALFLLSLSFCLQESHIDKAKRPLDLIFFISRSPFSLVYSYSVAYFTSFFNTFVCPPSTFSGFHRILFCFLYNML